jgi:hypothetical protein
VTEVALLLQLMTRVTKPQDFSFSGRAPMTFFFRFDVGKGMLTRDTRDAILAEPALLRNGRQRRIQAMNVNRLIAHIANYDLFLFVVELTDVAAFAVRALPRALLDEVGVERRLVTVTVIDSRASATLNHLRLLCLHVRDLLATCLALVIPSF